MGSQIVPVSGQVCAERYHGHPDSHSNQGRQHAKFGRGRAFVVAEAVAAAKSLNRKPLKHYKVSHLGTLLKDGDAPSEVGFYPSVNQFLADTLRIPLHWPDTGDFTASIALLIGFGNGKLSSPRTKGSRGLWLRHSDAEARPIYDFDRAVPVAWIKLSLGDFVPASVAGWSHLYLTAVSHTLLNDEEKLLKRSPSLRQPYRADNRKATKLIEARKVISG